MTEIVCIATICFIAFIMACFMGKRIVRVEKTTMREMDKKSLVGVLIENCKNMRTTEKGGDGIDAFSLYNKISSCNRKIEAKITNNVPLDHAEKWFYENYYLCYRYIFGRKIDLSALPHVQGEPRIVKIARIIVDNSLGDLTPERIKYLLSECKGVLSFTFDEIRSFNDAIAFAILERIYFLSRRITYQNDCEEKAKKGSIYEKFLSRDVYLFHLLNGKNKRQKALQILEKKGISEKDVITNYNLVQMKNTLMAETLFGALSVYNEFLPVHIGIRFLGAYQYICKTYNLERVSTNTLCSYFSTIEKIAYKRNVSEEFVARKAVEMAKRSGNDISIILFDHEMELKKSISSGNTLIKSKKKNRLAVYAYSMGILFSSMGLSVVLGIWFKSVAIGVLSFIPLFFAVETCINYIFSHKKNKFDPPSMNEKRVTYENATMVVVSEFIGSIGQLKESIFHAQTILEGNRDDNVEVALLIDTKGGKVPVSTLDEEIVDYLSTCVLDKKINVFLRKKHHRQDRFVAKERKRGAIMAFCKYLLLRDEFEFYYIRNKECFTPTYIITLDADNTIIPGEIRTMVNMITHPYNAQYDLLALHGRYNLYTIKNRYSTRYLSESGFENYPTYGSLFYTLFKEDVFCGKGIFRLRAFYNKLEELFPSEKILSHDVLEGSILSTGSGGNCFEAAPDSFLSERERRKRWLKGDVQLFPFLLGIWKNEEGSACKRNVSPLGRFIISKNILYGWKETALFALLLIGLFLFRPALWIGLSIFALPYAINGIRIIRNVVYREKVSSILRSTFYNVMRMLEEFFLMGYYAVDNLFLIVKTIISMIRKKGLLEWKTFYDSQGKRKFEAYIREFTLSITGLTGINFLLFLLVPGYNLIISLVYVITVLLTMVILFTLGKMELRNKPIGEEEKEKLRVIASETYKYFRYIRTPECLPGDNVQIKPFKGIARVTSPTNIGFAILAEICAYYLDEITSEESIFNIGEIINMIEEIPKWNGLLYNWYDTKKRIPVNEFVSSVDNGNLLAVLLVAERFLLEKGERILGLKVRFLRDSFQIKTLYDVNKGLFYIGFDGKKYTGHYDLLESEARILSFVYIALYGDYDHYSYLKKDYMGRGGNVLLSWSGTMFEALMADIFFPLPYGSALRKTSEYTAKRQSNVKKNGIWGISESGYYEFDADMKYQYKAFGINDLALRDEGNAEVFAPYASALALRYMPKKVVKNLEIMKRKSGYFPYGLVESIDERKEERIVCSAMTHHQGMILASITDYLCEEIIQKLFSSNPSINAVLAYFNDIQPKVRFVRKNKENKKKYATGNDNYYKKCDKIDESFTAYGLTNTENSVICNSFGGGFSLSERVFITKKTQTITDEAGIFFSASGEQGDWESPTFLPFRKTNKNYYFSCSAEEIVYSDGKDLTEKIAVLPSCKGEVREFTAEGNYTRCAVYLSLCLDEENAFDAHPCFRNLFVSVRQLSPSVISVEKRFPGEANHSFFLVVRVGGLANIEWDCNRLSCIGRGNSLFSANLYNDKTENKYPKMGDVLYPCVSIKGDFITTEKKCTLTLLYGSDERELINRITILPNNVYKFAFDSCGKYPLSSLTQDILGQILYAPRSKKVLNQIVSSGKREEFENYCHGKKIIRYSYDSDRRENVRLVMETIAQMRYFAIGVFLELCLPESAEEKDREYIRSVAQEKNVTEYVIMDVLSCSEFIPHIVINPDLSFGNKEFVADKAYEIMNNFSNNSDENLDFPEFYYRSGKGGFLSNGGYVVTDVPSMPYTNVIGYPKGGIIITSDGDGFYYFGNSRENKSIRFENDPVSFGGGDVLAVETNEGFSLIDRANGIDCFATIEQGKMTFSCRREIFSSECSHFMICDGSVRVLEISLMKKTNESLKLLYVFYPSLSWKYDVENTTFKQEGELITVTNVRNGQKLYVMIKGIDVCNLQFIGDNEPLPYFSVRCDKAEERIMIVSSEDLSLLLSINEKNMEIFKINALEYFAGKKRIDIVTKNKSFDLLVNHLPYQILSARINAKAGFYQVGGATGFRDQLQDSLAFFTEPEVIKKQIVACCIHQYEKGDVMHWWHEPCFGLRTRITDDKLFLPYAVCHYIRYSGDRSILEEEYPYLRSEPLAPEEKDRFENPSYSSYSENVFKHCIRAIRSALQYGEHKLLIMGNGDWNDGMDEVCSFGQGESVFNSMFAYWVITEFAELCPDDLKKELFVIAVELKNAVNVYAFEEDRYKRLFSDDGRWLGSQKSDILQLDLLVQAFAVLSGVADGERAIKCLESAGSLVDRQSGIIRLLFPPQTRKYRLGYISDYPKGVRENGGQYTHAAIWYLMALTKIGKQDEAYELFQMINPVEKCADPNKGETYGCEPYVLCGDVYSSTYYPGKGGWSWYTGSASWAYKLVTECFFGLKKRGEYLYIEPNLPKKLEGSTLVYRYRNSSYIIEYKSGLVQRISIDGIKTAGIELEENVRKTIVVETDSR